MRLLMTTDAVGGVWTYSLDLTRSLCTRGWNITLAVLGPPPDAAQQKQVAAIAKCNLVVTGLPLDWIAVRKKDMATAGEVVARLADRRRADLLHLNSPALAAEAALGRPVIGACHSCLASWWRAMRSGPMPADFDQHKALLQKGYAACSALIAPSRSFAEITAALYGIERPIVVHNGSKTQRRSLPPREPGLVLTAGRLWDEAKGMSVLVQAAKDVPATICAAGPVQAPHGDRIDLGTIVHIGTLDEVNFARWRERSGIFVACSYYEPFGLSVLEAALSGCALVLSDIPTFRELWDGAALFFPPGDSDALAMVLRRLIADPVTTAKLGQAARRRAAGYSLDKMVDRTEQIYQAHLPASVPAEVAA